MANSFQLSTIQHASAYWYERIPYTLTVGGLAANGGQQTLFRVQGWNRANVVSTLVTLESLAISQLAPLRIDVTADNKALRLWGGSFKPALEPSEVGAYAIQSMSLAVTNTDPATPMTNVQAVYTMAVWRMPIAYKVMIGMPLTPDEQDTARRVGLSTDPTRQRGTFPIPLSSVMERTYSNRIIDPPLTVADSFPATTQAQVIATFPAQTNQLLILRNIAAEADVDDGVVISVDRDDNADHVMLDAACLDLARGVDMFVPAIHALNCKIQSARNTSYNVPVRITIWRLALSNILRVRLGMLTPQQVQSIMGAQAGQKFVDDVVAGVS